MRLATSSTSTAAREEEEEVGRDGDSGEVDMVKEVFWVGGCSEREKYLQFLICS